MKIGVAALCDRATVREGLLHMLGGGVTQVALPFMPAALDLDLALLVTADDYREFIGSHKIGVTLLRSSDSLVIAQAEMSFEGPDVELPEDTPSPSIPLSVPLRGVAVPTHAMYQVSVTVDGKEHTVLPLLVKMPDATFGGATPQL